MRVIRCDRCKVDVPEAACIVLILETLELHTKRKENPCSPGLRIFPNELCRDCAGAVARFAGLVGEASGKEG